MKPLPLLAKFNIYPKGRWFFFQVFVWKKVSDMRRTLKSCGCPYRHTEAICCANRLIDCRKSRKVRKTGLLGQIHFYRGSFTMGIITHETTHAALAWAREVGCNPTTRNGDRLASKEEEAFCWVLGNLARQIVLKTSRQWNFDGSTVRNVTKYQ